MVSFITALISFMKGFQALKELGDQFASEWVKQDIARINARAESIKDEMDEVAAQVKEDETKDERRASLRRFTRID